MWILVLTTVFYFYEGVSISTTNIELTKESCHTLKEQFENPSYANKLQQLASVNTGLRGVSVGAIATCIKK